MPKQKRKKAPWPNVPPEVGRFIMDKLALDWDELARPCREVCRDCPADRDGEDSPCMSCPFAGLSTLAATVTLSSKMVRLMDDNTKSSSGNE